MFNWLWENFLNLLKWLWNLPLLLAQTILGVLTDLIPDSVLGELGALKPYLEIVNCFVPLVETLALTATMFAFEIAFIGIRTVFRIIRG